MLPSSILEIFRCLHCKKSLVEQDIGLRCSGCGCLHPFINGTYKFVDAEQYAASFGFQWQVYDKTQLDNGQSQRTEQNFRENTDFTPEELRGKLILDVGCGIGRHADVATRWGAHVVGIDLSLASEVAARNLKDRATATFLQANVFSLPFAPESFDYIYSIGVLHHTPDCELAFKSLVPLLKPGGKISIWLYSAYNPYYKFSDVYRKLTSRLPPRVLLSLCQIAGPLHYLHLGLRKIPIFGRLTSGAIQHFLPISQNPDWEWRVLDTFDWYSPVYQSKHTYEEVFRWFEQTGLEARVLHSPIGIQGRRPISRV